MIVYCLVIYLISVISLLFIAFYYVDEDGERINEGNTLGDFFFIGNNSEKSDRIIVYCIGLNTVILVIILVNIIIERFDVFVRFLGEIRILKRLNSSISKLLNKKIR